MLTIPNHKIKNAIRKFFPENKTYNAVRNVELKKAIDKNKECDLNKIKAGHCQIGNTLSFL